MLTVIALGLAAQTVRAHCEVPCGIYDDQLRF
ncbi:MAG: superoxide dismutase [Ni] [Aureliella sp.]